MMGIVMCAGTCYNPVKRAFLIRKEVVLSRVYKMNLSR